MKKLIYLIIPIFFLGSCIQSELTPDEIIKVKETIETQIQVMRKAYNLKDVEAVKGLVSESEDILVFGTDAAEVMKSASDWEQQMKNDFQLFDYADFGEAKYQSIKVSRYGDMAASVTESLVMMVIKADTFNLLLRFAFTWKLENGSWHIVQGNVSAPSENQLSQVLKEQMDKEEKRNDN